MIHAAASPLDLVTLTTYAVPIGIAVGTMIGAAIGTAFVAAKVVGVEKLTGANKELTLSHLALAASQRDQSAAENELADTRRKIDDADADSCRNRLEEANGKIATLETMFAAEQIRVHETERRLDQTEADLRNMTTHLSSASLALLQIGKFADVASARAKEEEECPDPPTETKSESEPTAPAS